MSDRKVTIAMPTAFPKSFAGVEEELSRVINKLSTFREKKKEMGNIGNFFDEFESLYLEAMSKTGEERHIMSVTLIFIWSQMMAIASKKGE